MINPKEPSENSQVTTDNSDTVIIIDDVLGDTTVRPRRPNVPRGWPGRETEEPSAGKQDGNPPAR